MLMWTKLLVYSSFSRHSLPPPPLSLPMWPESLMQSLQSLTAEVAMLRDEQLRLYRQNTVSCVCVCVCVKYIQTFRHTCVYAYTCLSNQAFTHGIPSHYYSEARCQILLLIFSPPPHPPQKLSSQSRKWQQRYHHAQDQLQQQEQLIEKLRQRVTIAEEGTEL